MPITHDSIRQQPAPRPQDDAPALLVRDLHFHYPDGHQALRGVSMCLQSGEKVALVGPNGSGKSTLMLHLNGLLTGEGQLAVAGMAVEKRNLSRIRALVGMVFQNPDDQLFSPTVFEDVAFGPLHLGLAEEEVRRRAEKALVQVGMDPHAERPSYHLSIGQKKRVAIATVLVMEPALLLLDEPTASLDPRGRRELIELLSTLPQTMLVSTHDMALVRALFPRMIVMENGRIAADGPSQQLLADNALLERYGLA